ncbi:ATP-dependent zinc metallopeptidase, putative [Leishmania donovani]|uniref:ATP-dependent zinc metallopeptidase, putative n=1 Tax=Leishmania donovani TaxID=5661 RepID=E9BMJ6_LEIDO|nr:ATP-dependent zinc metallopeptidase, putative [Leishmania donovani]AYU81259.1 ATP-dependent zinc metallopeptidase, putative [Leishmania donovani]CBZ36474.1 ATP-dependent zinc metallopeptidase, putative [Leishmania donovani]
MQSLAAVTPSYFSAALQSRYTRVPATGTQPAQTPSTPTSLSDVMTTIRCLSYADRLHRHLGTPRHVEDVCASVKSSQKLSALFETLRQRPIGSASSTAFHTKGVLLSKDGGHRGGENGKGEEEGAADEGEDKPEDWIVPRTCLFVLIMIAITVVLYQLARPSGTHTGWASLNKHAGEIKEAVLYENYLQVYMDDAKVYLGLVNDHDTQRHMDELADNYRAARKQTLKAQQQQSGETAPADGGKHEHGSKLPMAADTPAELELTMKGRPFAETALIGVGAFAWVVPFIFFPVFVMFLSQYIGKSMSYAVEATKGKTKAKEMIFRVETASNTRFRDIAGMKEPKKEITEIVDFLRHPERYTKLGAKIPTGAILLGPPGTGKTLLAKAVAGESGVGFIPAIGSDFVELYVGMGALRVRQLFKEARKQRCIIYIDEIDAIGLKRQGAGHGEKQEQEQTLNELLTQLDGFSTGRRGDVMVLASSNVAQEALDPALIRPGRFDRIIHVDTPVISERIDIFKVHLSKLKLTSDDTRGDSAAATTATAGAADGAAGGADAPTAPPLAAPVSTETSLVLSQVKTEERETAEERQRKDDASAAVSADAKGISSDNPSSNSSAYEFDIRSLLMQKSERERALIDAYAQRMSNLCPGFVGADIANVCNEGAILAAREGADHVSISHLERSIDRVLAGIEHRSRALSDFEKNVVAHHEAGHAVAGWFLHRADPLMKVSIVPRGGSALGYAQYLPNENFTRTAKEIRDSISVTLGGRAAEQIFFNHLSTGASDDLRKVAKMAYQYVSSFAPGSVYPPPGSNSTRLVKPFGVDKANDFDRRAKTLVDEVYADTLALLTKHKDDMKKLADHLLKHELLTYADVVHYLGERTTRQTDRKKGV